MSHYYGSTDQIRLQRKADTMAEWVMQTPGACLTGRAMGTDDPGRLGWDVIERHLLEDGIHSFRWMNTAREAEVVDFAQAHGGKVFAWDSFVGEVQDFERVEAAGLPEGYAREHATGPAVRDMQVAYVAQGMAPLSGAVLAGENCQAQSHVIRDARGAIAAMGFIGMLQNRFSVIRDMAWVGLIATDEAHRGRGLGAQVTTGLIKAALQDYGASSVMAGASESNAASRAMLRRCGLAPREEKSLVVSLKPQPFTR